MSMNKIINNYSLSSWNYGNFALYNPYTNNRNIFKTKSILTVKSPNIINVKINKIVDDNFFKNYNYMKYINRNNNKSKTCTNFRVCGIKNENQGIDNRLTFKMWKRKKSLQRREKEEKEKEEMMKKEAQKKEQREIRKNILMEKKKKKNIKNKSCDNKKNVKIKKNIKNKISFKDWLIKKKEGENKSKKNINKNKNFTYSNMKVIKGPYTYASKLMKMSNNI